MAMLLGQRPSKLYAPVRLDGRDLFIIGRSASWSTFHDRLFRVYAAFFSILVALQLSIVVHVVLVHIFIRRCHNKLMAISLWNLTEL